MRMWKCTLALCAAVLGATAADAPKAWLTVSATNLTVTETATAAIHLRLPPLKAPYENEPPILNQRPPHFSAPFLEQDWKPGAITPGSVNQIGQGAPRNGANVRVFTLNNYVSNDIFSSMRDPFNFFGGDPFEHLGPKPQRFPFMGVRDDRGNWHFTIPVPQFKAKAPGRARFDSVVVDVETIASVDQRGRVSLRKQRIRTEPVEVAVSAPPAEGRRADWCGAIGRSFSAAAALDVNVCTAGDPLILSLTLTGNVDPDTILPPDASLFAKSPAFRIDPASVKTAAVPDGKRFTWRVRAVKAGTIEFPPISVSYYDVGKRAYIAARTESLPIQVKAGAQAALGAVDEEDETFPTPDGLDLDFALAGNADFTLRRAFALATRAVKPADFAEAAKVYSEYLESPGRAAPSKEIEARHLCNLAALRFMSGDYRAALSDYDAAERAVGETPSTLRGIRASWAHLKNDPRAELPLQRILLPFWYRHSMPVRLAMAGGLLAALVLLFFVAVRTGSRFALVVLAVGISGSAEAQFWSFGTKAAGVVDARLALEPSQVVVGEPCAFIVELDVKKGTGVEQLRVGGLPDSNGGAVEYGEAFEPIVDGPAPAKDRELRRFRLSARFLAPYSGQIAASASGMAVTRTTTRFGSSTFSSSFDRRMKPLSLDVRPLPESGKPKGFAGAVGRGFRLEETFSPSRVRPGDLVTVTYRLTFDGYFPPGTEPRIADFGPAFRVYDLKEKSRGKGEIVWQQMVVPETTAATNGAAAEVDFYDLARRRYAVARAPRPSLVFVSAEKASTENTTVTIAGGDDKTAARDAAARATETLEVRFAPAETSPTLFRLPPGAAYEEISRNGAWRRISTPRGVGWIMR